MRVDDIGGIEQDGAAGAGKDAAEQCEQLFLEGRAALFVARRGEGAEEEEERAGLQQRVARVALGFRERFAEDEDGFTDGDLVFGLEGVIFDAQAVDEGAGAGVAVDEAVAIG